MAVVDEYLSGWLFSSVYVETYVRMSYVIAELFVFLVGTLRFPASIMILDDGLQYGSCR